MYCEQHLALSAVLTGLRQAGAIDRHAIKCIVAALEETEAKSRPHCAESADSLKNLAQALKDGPGRSCTISVAA